MTMKHLHLVIVFCYIFPSLSFSNPIDREKAREIAASVIGEIRQDETVPAKSIVTGDQTTQAYYIFNAVGNKGFAIVSGDDCFPAIVGYSQQGVIDENHLPPALSAYLSEYETYMKAAREGEAESPESRYPTQSLPSESTDVLSCSWGQDKPYNNLCPSGTVVGCVATAMAQIMYYHKWPVTGSGKDYTTYNSSSISVDFSQSTYNWSAMKDTKAGNLSDETAAAAVARICFDCGVASKMVYGSSSAAYTDNAVKAFYTNFGYNAATIRHITRDCYATAEEWMDIVKVEISAGRPIFYEGVSSSGGGKDAAGHAFVVDGYDADNYVHVNWGWDGEANGYYNIKILAPQKTSYSFTDNQGMIIGIQPARESVGIFVPHPYMASGITTTATSIDYAGTASEKFIIATPDVYNLTAVRAKWKTGIGLYNAKGSFLSSFQKILTTQTVEPNYGINATNYSCSLPANLEDGEYAIKMFFKSGSEYIEPDVVGGQAKNYIHLTIANGKATFDTKPIASGISHVAVGNKSSERIYNLSGQTVGKNYHGLVIGTGKKKRQ